MKGFEYYPTPWRTDESEHDAPHQNIEIVAADGTNIVTVWIDDACFDANPERRRIARLFAAAPDLLDALEEARKVHNYGGSCGACGAEPGCDIDCPVCRWTVKADTAIAKARGRS